MKALQRDFFTLKLFIKSNRWFESWNSQNIGINYLFFLKKRKIIFFPNKANLIIFIPPTYYLIAIVVLSPGSRFIVFEACSMWTRVILVFLLPWFSTFVGRVEKFQEGSDDDEKSKGVQVKVKVPGRYIFTIDLAANYKCGPNMCCYYYYYYFIKMFCYLYSWLTDNNCKWTKILSFIK